MKYLRYFLVILLAIFFIFNNHSAVLAESNLAQWAVPATGGSDISEFVSNTTDSDKNIYAAGYINGTSTYNFGSGVTVNGTYSGNNAAVVKYNSSGVAQWAVSTASGLNNSVFSSITIDSDKNIYAAGYIIGTGTYNFGNGVTVTGTYNGNNIVVVKYNSSGVAQWAVSTASGLNNSVLNSITIDSDKNIYVSGVIFGNGTFNFGGGVTANGSYNTGYNLVVIKYNSSGVAQWATSTTGGSNNSVFNSITIDSDKNIYAAGTIYSNGIYDFGNGVTVTGGYDSGNNTVVVKYNSSGVAQWAVSTIGGSGVSILRSLVIDSDKNIYAAGYIGGNGTYNFGSGVTVNGGYDGGLNTAVIKYNSSGVAQWAVSTNIGPNASIFKSITIDSDKNIYAAGYINSADTFDFGSGVTVNGGYSDSSNTVVVEYNSLGVAQWAVSTTGGLSSSLFNSITLDSDKNIYAAGYIYSTGTYNFGNGVTVNGGYSASNAVMVKYRNISTPTPTPTISSSSDTNNSSGSNSSSAPTCTDSKPIGISDLFQINTTNNSAKLYFTPLSTTNQYFISFSTNSNAEENGEQVSLLREGVQSETINFLKPNTTYYFKVRGQNGCTPGDWSNIMKIKTGNSIFYKNSSPVKTLTTSVSKPSTITKSTKINSVLLNTPTPIISQTPQPTISPKTDTPTETKSKKCLLWWCW
jgi:hypothetical protein